MLGPPDFKTDRIESMVARVVDGRPDEELLSKRSELQKRMTDLQAELRTAEHERELPNARGIRLGIAERDLALANEAARALLDPSLSLRGISSPEPYESPVLICREYAQDYLRRYAIGQQQLGKIEAIESENQALDAEVASLKKQIRNVRRR